jgi:hypothetical protein
VRELDAVVVGAGSTALSRLYSRLRDAYHANHPHEPDDEVIHR